MNRSMEARIRDYILNHPNWGKPQGQIPCPSWAELADFILICNNLREEKEAERLREQAHNSFVHGSLGPEPEKETTPHIPQDLRERLREYIRNVPNWHNPGTAIEIPWWTTIQQLNQVWQELLVERAAESKPAEADPTGRSAHEPGAKLDAGKIRPQLVLGAFARALWEVCRVGTYGAAKYTDDGWLSVPNGKERYADAKLRHWLKECMDERVDSETQILHAAHEAWNALARLELLLREKEEAEACSFKAPEV